MTVKASERPTFQPLMQGDGAGPRMANAMGRLARTIVHDGMAPAIALVAEDGAQRLIEQSEKPAPFTPMDDTARAYSALRAGVPDQSRIDVSQALAHASIDFQMGHYEAVRDGLRVLNGIPEFALFAAAVSAAVEGGIATSLPLTAAPSEDAASSVVNGLDLEAVAKGLIPPPQPHLRLYLERMAVARGVLAAVEDPSIDSTREAPDYPPAGSLYESLSRRTNFWPHEGLVIQDPTQPNHASTAAHHLAGFAGYSQDTNLLFNEIMFRRLIPHDASPERNREQIGKDHVSIMRVLVHLMRTARGFEGEWDLARAMLDQTSWSHEPDDHFLIHRLRPAIEALRLSQWERFEKLMALHLLRGTEKSPDGDHDPHLELFGETVGMFHPFAEVWPSLVEKFGPLAQYPQWAAMAH